MPEQINSFTGEYRWLSNFYPAPAKCHLDGLIYPTAEHAYQACKFTSPEDRDAIMNCKTPGQAKRLGRRLKSIPSYWDDVRVGMMLETVRSKFRMSVDLQEKLISTGTAELVERNDWGDTFWGVSDGVGKNKLGLILTQVRCEFSSAKRLGLPC